MAHSFTLIKKTTAGNEKVHYFSFTVSGTDYAFEKPFQFVSSIVIRNSGTASSIPVGRQSGNYIVLSGLTTTENYVVKVTGF